jgi:hypothetical protein
VLPDLVDRHDVGMVQERDRLGLVLEAAQLIVGGEHVRLEHLERDRPVQADLAGLIHDPHAAAAQLLVDLVIAKVSYTIAAAQTVPGRSAGLSTGCPHGAPVLCRGLMPRGVSRRRIRIRGQRRGRFGGGPRVGRWQHGRLVEDRIACRTEDVMRPLVSAQQYVDTPPQLGISLTGLVQVHRPVRAWLAVQSGHEDLFDSRSRGAQCSPPASGVYLDLLNQCSVSLPNAPGGLGFPWN